LPALELYNSLTTFINIFLVIYKKQYHKIDGIKI
jgi:hypothetical protein